MGFIADKIAETSRELDARFNLKHVHKRLQAIAKVLIVTTFMEDALRVLLTFQVQQNSMRIAGWQLPILHSLFPILSFCIQSGGSLLVVLPGDSMRGLAGCYMLFGWCLWHPFMYGQQTNWEFMLETLTIMGGLAVLISHFMLLKPGKQAGLPSAKASVMTDSPLSDRANRIQAVGRMMIISIFLFYAFQKVGRIHAALPKP